MSAAPASSLAPPHPGTVRCEREVIESALRARIAGDAVPALPADSRLAQLAAMFGLSPFETDLVALLWTMACAPSWHAEVASHDPFPGHVTVLGAARALDHPPRPRLASESPLRLWRLAAEHPFVEGTAALSIDPHLVAWLEGEHELDRLLVGHVRVLEPSFELPSWRLDARADRVAAGLQTGDRWRVRIAGHDRTAVDAFAAGLARRLGVLALVVAPGAARPDEVHERAVRVQRQAFLDRSAPCWPGRDAEGAWPAEVTPFPLQLVAGPEPLPADARFRDVVFAAGDPDPDERRALWLGAVPSSASWPPEQLDDLARRCEASSGEILRASAAEPRDPREAAQRIRESASDDLAGLAQRMCCSFAWGDLVVPPAVRERLEDIAFEARERTQVWSEPEAVRYYPQGRGLVALFAGPPGTGKTMAAQVIAADLGLDLLRVDLSRVLSKWVGETAQHLQQVLSSASSRRAVLLFDEADALFGRRIEDARQAQDHFVNMDLSHLMIALESYTGVVLLATNLKANLDAAFVRRIRHAVDFAMPDQPAREAIWAKAAEVLFGTPPGEAVRDAVARVSRLEASGAQIKNAALSAVFAARRARSAPDAALFGRMLARELAKDGASLSARELEATLGVAL